MSLEQVILLIAFVVVPLIQFLRGARQRAEDEGAEAEDQQQSAGRPPAPVLPAAVAHAPVRDATVAPDRMAQRSKAPASLPVPLRSTRLLTAQSLRVPLNLRRAIVVMTVLEPCRALQPYDRAEQG